MEATEIQQHEIAEIEEFADKRDTMLGEIRKVIVGQDEVIEEVLIALFARGHCLLVGVPGLAKTLLISTLSEILDLDFNRIQFTPDLMPSDITGTDILQEDGATGRRTFQFLRGPIFTNILLADEINRTPPKTQAALLQSMQEYKVTAGGSTFALDLPFFVLATQNPIEQEGTYPLPEAQQDRFMFKVFVKYPSYDEEFRIAEATTAELNGQVVPVQSGADIVRFQHFVRRVPIAPFVIHYALRLVRATRVHEGDVPAFVNDSVSWGAGPRGVQYLLLGGKARAVLQGRCFVTTDDIRAVAKPVLRHRVITNFNAESSRI
ncbi:MAG TPA: AAA family ATPase, partial [Candidatus Binatus sp.]|nr:AAA family ATPase [Candidatus Binatus sp.]